jgi:hypothetical protein
MPCESDDLTKLANMIYGKLVSKYRIGDLMKIVRENREHGIYLIAERFNPSDVIVEIDKNGVYRYQNGETLVIPIPKRFAVLEPDENYFRMTLKANIFLALNGADEKDLHI